MAGSLVRVADVSTARQIARAIIPARHYVLVDNSIRSLYSLIFNKFEEKTYEHAAPYPS